MAKKDSRPLTWDEMKNFKWSEASNLTWEDLQKNRDILLKDIENEDIEVSYSVYTKVKELCNDLSINDPRVKKGMTIKDVCYVLTFALNMAEKLPGIIEKCQDKIIDLLEILLNSH